MNQFWSASSLCISSFSLFAAGCAPEPASAPAPQVSVGPTSKITLKQPPEFQAAGITAEPYEERQLPLSGRPEVTFFSVLPAREKFDASKQIGFVDLSGFETRGDGVHYLPIGGELTIEVNFAKAKCPEKLSLLYFAMETAKPDHRGEKIAFVEVSVLPNVNPLTNFAKDISELNPWQIKASWLARAKSVHSEITDRWMFNLPSGADYPYSFRSDISPLGAYLTVEVRQVFEEAPPADFLAREAWRKKISHKYFRAVIRNRNL